MNEKEMWLLVKIGALMGVGFELSSQIMWTVADAVKSLFGLGIG